MRSALLAVVLALSSTGCAGRDAEAIRDGGTVAPTASPSMTPTPARATMAAPTPTAPPADPVLLPADQDEVPEDIPGGGQPQTVTVPILLYHHIRAHTPPVRYTIAAQRFEQQLDYLLAHGYQTITMQDLRNAIETGAPLPDQSVMLTFDDGNRDLLELAFPRMQARGMVGVAYVVANRIGVEGFLDPEDLQTLRRAGWEIGSHGMTHRALDDLTGEDLTGEDLTEEVARSKALIEGALGEPIRSFAYPFGIVTEKSLLAVMRAGYATGAGLGLGNVHRPGSLFYLSRREVWGTYEMPTFQGLLGPQ